MPAVAHSCGQILITRETLLWMVIEGTILAFAAGCVSAPLAPGAAAVVITRDPAAVSSCSPVGNVALDAQQQRTDPVGQQLTGAR